MNEQVGDLWRLHVKGAVVAITTGGLVSKKGECAMPRGCARQAKDRFPGLAAQLGQLITAHGNHVYDLGQRIVSFPVENSPYEVPELAIIERSCQELVQLADDKREHNFELPREYQSRNVLVEVIGGGKKRSVAVYSNELQTAVSERYGILTVRHAKDDRPLPATYVKVYAMTGSGPKFYKDGYTDLRGKFDYATVSTTDIAGATKFSLLVMSEEHGATVLEAPVPQR